MATMLYFAILIVLILTGILLYIPTLGWAWSISGMAIKEWSYWDNLHDGIYNKTISKFVASLLNKLNEI
jgi:hypothetical protein